MNRFAVAAVATLAAAALVTGCASNDSGKSPGNPGASPDSPTGQGTGKGAATGSGDATATVKIGVSGGFSGPTAALGQDAKRGIELAIEDLNRDNPSVKYELATADDECSPQGGATAYGSLIDVDKVNVILGSPCSGSTLAGIPILKRGKVPGMTFGASSSEISKQSGVGGNEYSWRMNIDDDIMGQAFSDLIAKQGVKTISILAVNNDFGIGAAEVYKKYLPDDGVKVVGVETYDYQAADLRPQLTKISGQKVDAMMFFGEAPNCALLMRNKKEVGLDIPVFSRSACTTEEALKAMKDPQIGKGVTEVSYWSGTDNQPMIQEFQDKYGEYPPYNAAMAYYGMQVIGRAVEAGGPSTEGIEEGLAKVDWDSPIGPIKFDDHHQAHHDMFVLTITDGKIVVEDRVPTS